MAKARGLTPGQAKRIAAPVKKYENYYQFPAGAARTPPAASSGRTVPVICPSAGIPAGSRTGPQNGMGTFAIPGTGDALQAGDAVKLWNYLAVAVGSGSKTGFAAWWGGKWVLISWEC